MSDDLPENRTVSSVRTRTWHTGAAVCVVAALAAGCTRGAETGGESVVRDEGVKVRVLRGDEEIACLCARVADTEEERVRGLSHTGDPAPYDAMVFSWEEPTIARLWMRDTPGPLDAVFVDARGRVERVERMPECGTECPVHSAAGASRFVLEMRDGSWLRVGDALEIGEGCSR